VATSPDGASAPRRNRLGIGAGGDRAQQWLAIGAGLMNSRQKTIVRVLQLIFCPVAAIILIVLAVAFYGIATGSNSVVITDAGRAPQTDWVTFAFVVFFVFAAPLVEFLARERFRLRPRDGMGTVVIEIGPEAGVVRFVPLIAVFPFVVGLNRFLLQPDIVDVDVRSLTLTEPLFLWLLYGSAHFLFVAFLLRAIRNRSFVVWTDKGFLYEPGDISPGLIHWEDVARIKEAEGLMNRKTMQVRPLEPCWRLL
jgi:hypothetical protein